ncbi:redox protein [Vibrio breoganii]|uniref:DUF393 domain-containing protein n=1 Tax=Vibrio breoganii TaxID=553239 RepID=A0ABX1U2U3_9VIBR|nr:DUF393 domain-containing protein [Vibrio breoganii]MDN3714913.1 DUF393 domain-containing protein [Vibrio breoganii]NMO72952.1 DUF393 domain-containing protein [Vibrio breoganii]NMR68789.1 DUF393 domain-containing protein [Vibrio breoganii]PMG03886.1 redox protein [Vibrio breoganii]PML91036.1 redox protein [Vibrio breoganii]
MGQFTLFYDGTCPLCVKEMASLKKHDTSNQLLLVDIHAQHFTDYPYIDAKQASVMLHALNEEGKLLLGLDVTYQAWSRVGKGWLYAPTRWKLFRPLCDKIYLWFARNRYSISRWLTGSSRCDSCRLK